MFKNSGGNKLKKKTICIFVCMLMIATLAIPISAMNKDDVLENKPISIGADVPTWEVGDSWTYDTHYYQAIRENNTIVSVWDGSLELTLEVIDDTGDVYTLQGNGKPKGGFDLSGIIDMKTTRFSNLDTTVKLYKSNLAIIENEYVFKAILLLTLGPIPLPIPIQMKAYMLSKFEPVWELLPFPLYDGKTGYTPQSTLNQTSDMSIFWGIIPIQSETSDEGWVGNATYECVNESITVPAGNYDVYNITSSVNWSEYGEDWYHSYYCEEVGNIVKCAYNIDQDDGETVVLWEMELLSTTYTP